SYGFRPGRSCKDALREVDRLLKEGYTFVVDADVTSYFDTIPHDKLMALVAGRISDGRVLALIDGFLRQDIMTDMACWQPTTGTPQGAVLSPPGAQEEPDGAQGQGADPDDPEPRRQPRPDRPGP